MIVHFVRPVLSNQTELRIKLFFREINDLCIMKILAIKLLNLIARGSMVKFVVLIQDFKKIILT